jgi:high affinity Mn2+ porin
MRELLVASAALMALAGASHADAADSSLPIPVKAPPVPAVYDWSGFYAGSRVGYAWGTSNWTSSTPGAPNYSGSVDLFQPFDAFKDTGSFSQGLQAGYNYMLRNRIVVGAEADVTFPGFPNNAGISIGGISNLASPTLGAETFSETVLTSGTVRGRIGYAPGSWLFYATGGFAWTYNQLSLTQLANGTTESPFLWRLGWAAGAGFEVPVAPHWTARLEYLFTDNGNSSTTFFAGAQRIGSNFALQELRAGLNYQFGNVALPTPMVAKAAAAPDPGIVNFHGQMTFLEQAYPAFRSPYQGPNSLPGSGQGRETWDASLFVGVRIWRGAELWINPEIDQGFGLANTFGVA